MNNINRWEPLTLGLKIRENYNTQKRKQELLFPDLVSETSSKKRIKLSPQEKTALTQNLDPERTKFSKTNDEMQKFLKLLSNANQDVKSYRNETQKLLQDFIESKTDEGIKRYIEEEAQFYEEISNHLNLATFKTISQKFGKEEDVVKDLCVFVLDHEGFQNASYDTTHLSFTSFNDNPTQHMIQYNKRDTQYALEFLKNNGKYVKSYAFEFNLSSCDGDLGIFKKICELCPNLNEFTIVFREEENDKDQDRYEEIFDVCASLTHLTNLELSGSPIDIDECKEIVGDHVRVIEF